jgi:hypothetical protein
MEAQDASEETESFEGTEAGQYLEIEQPKDPSFAEGLFAGTTFSRQTFKRYRGDDLVDFDADVPSTEKPKAEIPLSAGPTFSDAGNALNVWLQPFSEASRSSSRKWRAIH